MIETAKPYWIFRKKYLTLNDTAKRMVLAGQALLMLRDTSSEAVKKRLAAFITFECNRLRVPDKTATYL